jgi:hypothetical protein
MLPIAVFIEKYFERVYNVPYRFVKAESKRLEEI